MDNALYQPKVLLIDDTQDVRDAFRALLEAENYQYFEASDGQKGIEKAVSLQPDLILLDVMMPEMDGFETCSKLRAIKETSDIPIIMVTALDDRESKIKGLNSGADDFLSKPIDSLIFKARVKTITKLNRFQKLKHHEEETEKTLKQTVNLLSDLLSLTLHGSQEDSYRVIQILTYLAEKLKIKDLEQLKYAALLLNIGKLALPADILKKYNNHEEFTNNELNIYNSYPSISKALIRKISGFRHVAEIISYALIEYHELKALKPTLNHPAFLGHLIFCTKTLDRFIMDGFSPKQIEGEMLKTPDKYHPKIVTLLKHATPIMYESSPVMLKTKDLRVGMLCYSDIISTQGTPILKKGEIINQANLERIMVFVKGVGIQEPVTMLRKLDHKVTLDI